MLLANPDINEREISSILNLASGVITHRDTRKDTERVAEEDLMKADSINILALIDGPRVGGESN